MTSTPGGIPTPVWTAITQQSDARGEGVIGLLSELARLRDAIPSAIAEIGTLARDEGATWAQIAEALGYRTPAQARQAVNRAAAARKKAADRARQEAIRQAQPTSPAEPGISISEAARVFGVTRPTIYAWAREGRITTVQGRRGQRIVAGPDGETISPSSPSALPAPPPSR